MARILADLLVHGAAELVSVAGAAPKRGARQGESACVRGGALASHQGTIVAVGPEAAVRAAIDLEPGAEQLDARGGLVTPGLVDAHTHPVFAGYRESEFNRLLQGESYADIARSGGGIRSTVRTTRAAPTDQLEVLACERLERMLLHGTTLAEAKSGYGLTLEDELRSLEVIARLGNRHPLRLEPTLLAAHTVPPEYDGRADAWIDRVVQEVIPASQSLARFIDVFCDPTAFTPAQSRRVLEAGMRAGLGARIHADEFDSSGGAELAAELGAVSADHLGGMNEEAIERLAARGVSAVLLPGTLFFLGRKSYAPARKLIQGGVAVALGTDLNPGTSHTESMTVILQLACLMMRMTIDEALVAATLNAAHSLGRSEECGSLEPGKRADLVVFAVPNRFHLVYHYGVNHVEHVVANGRIVVRDRRTAAGRDPVAVL